MGHLLEINNLEVKFALPFGEIVVVDNLSLTLNENERLGVVGESGAGKSVTGFSIIDLISKPGNISKGEVLFKGKKINGLSNKLIRQIRGNDISMIFQDPMMTLNPVFTIGVQMIETLKAHQNITTKEARNISIETIKKVYISSPEKILKQYPHELSGGMKQRIVIAIALLNNPSLIIADEPTTALDVTIQSMILDLLIELCKNEKMGLLLITHDLAVVSQVTDKIAIMYAGKIVETGDTQSIINNPKHYYTLGLINSLPSNDLNNSKLLNSIEGNMPDLKDIPIGCAFYPRCPQVKDICKKTTPQLLTLDGSKRAVACHHYRGEL